MTKQPIKPGVYPNTPFPVYQSWDAINNSKLVAGLRSAAHLRHAIDHPDDTDTPETRIGHALHCLVWQRDEFSKRYEQVPNVDGRTKEGKAVMEAARATGRTILRHDEWSEANRLDEAVLANEDAWALIDACDLREVAIVWEDEATGILRKAMIDGLRTDPATAFLCDLKSTRDAKPSEFSKSIFNFNYHIQLAGYREAVKAGFGLNVPAMLIAVEKDEPHPVAVYELDDEAAAIGWAEDRRLLAMLKECRETGVWPAYGVGVKRIGLPAWAVNRHMQEEVSR